MAMQVDLQALIDDRLEGRKSKLLPDDVICFTYQQIADLVGVSRRHIARQVEHGHLSALWLGPRLPRVALDELRRWLRARHRTSPSRPSRASSELDGLSPG